ncbi:MAG TPA: response regulator [Acidimicrobiales bacterium]|nr:response regulator [Acidimicrobiales bacterium]
MNARVLIVDDRPDNLLALEATLEPLDVVVTRAASGPDALRQVLIDDFAVILLDVQMPGMDGYETARLIKSRARSADVPIIFLTAISRETEHQLRGYEAGAVDYLAKPFEPEVLRSKVAVFMALHEQARTIEEQNRLLAERLEERDRAQAALGRHAAELQRSNAELDRFASVVGHDLLEPLHVVGGLLEVLADRHGGELDDEGRMLVDRARARASGLTERVDELLAGARGSVEPLRLAPTDLGLVLDRARQELDGRIEEAGVALHADPLPEVVGDEWLLSQVFSLLLDHALRTVADVDPEVDVGLSRRDDDWVICVRTNGPALDEDEAARLFASFGGPSQDGAGDDADDPGPASGLAVCRRIVERHGGTIWVESAPGRGTDVCFTLPVATGEDLAGAG